MIQRMELDEGAKNILEWNKRRVLSCILSIEDHMEELPEQDIPHSWCNVKHYLLALDHHLLEASGHAERAGLPNDEIKRFRQKLLDLNMYPEPHVSLLDVVKLRNEWRRIIKDPTLGVDCPMCDQDAPRQRKLVSELKKLHYHDNELADMEREMAEKALSYLSSKYDVSPPKLIITEECNSPVQGTHVQYTPNPKYDFIKLCKGNVNLHVLTHEFIHYLHHIQNKEQNEEDVEQEAVEELQFDRKSLKVEEHNFTSGGKGMWKKQAALVITGGQFVVQGITGFESTLETTLGVDNTTIVEAAGGAGALIVGAMGKMKEPIDTLLMVLGGGLLAHGVMRAVKKLTTPVASYSAPIRLAAVSGQSGRAQITSAGPPGSTTYATPTRLTAGYPQVALADGGKWVDIKV